MDSKLTLTIEQSLIKKAKQYARSNGRSLSDLVESYFKLLAEESKKGDEIELTPAVKSLLGAFKAPDDFDYKKILLQEKVKKYG